MRNDLHILIVMKAEMRHTAKILALVAVSEWPRLTTHFRCLRAVFKQHRHHCLPSKIFPQTFFLTLVPAVQIRWWIWATEGRLARLPYELMHATEENSILQHQAWRSKEPSPTASPRIVWLYLSINSRYRKWEIVRSYKFHPLPGRNDHE